MPVSLPCPPALPRPLSKADAAIVRGCLVVRARTDTTRGLSSDVVPAGSLGFVIASRPGGSGRGHLVFWPFLPSRFKGDHRTGSHALADLEPVGRMPA